MNADHTRLRASSPPVTQTVERCSSLDQRDPTGVEMTGAMTTVLRCRLAGRSGTVTATFDAQPDLDMARRWRSSFRRIDCVEVLRTAGGVRCSVHGAGHRLPSTRSVPLRVGLGLAVLGTPLVLRIEEN